MVPTPIHQWCLPGVPSPFSVWVKRDDLTSCSLTGNKVYHSHGSTVGPTLLSLQARKAEFLLADAMDRGCDCVITFGSVTSNHARVMAVAAREIGMDAVLFIQTPASPVSAMTMPRQQGATGLYTCSSCDDVISSIARPS